MTNEALQQLRERLQAAEHDATKGSGTALVSFTDLMDAQRAIVELLELRGKSDDDYR